MRVILGDLVNVFCKSINVSQTFPLNKDHFSFIHWDFLHCWSYNFKWYGNFQKSLTSKQEHTRLNGIFVVINWHNVLAMLFSKMYRDEWIYSRNFSSKIQRTSSVYRPLLPFLDLVTRSKLTSFSCMTSLDFNP